MLTAEIVAIGDELTSGQRLDTNSQWISQQLADLGIRVLLHTTVADDLETGIQVICQALERVHFVVCTGGLGPTADDLTRETIAQATARPLQQDKEALAHIENLFRSRNREMPASNIVQSMFPEGSLVIPNPHGSAPGIDLTVNSSTQHASRIFALPGVPAEMFEMWNETVQPRIISQIGGQRRLITHHQIKCFGIGESDLEQMLPDLIRRGRQPTVGITVSQATITLRISAEGNTTDECHAAMQETIATIHDCLGDLVFGEGDLDLPHVIPDLLQAHGLSLATLECGSTGLMTQWLGELSVELTGYQGGWVIPHPALLNTCWQDHNASQLSTVTAEELVRLIAQDACQRLETDIVLVLGPEPTNTAWNHADDRIHYALAIGTEVRCSSSPYRGHPAILRARSAKQALNFLRLTLGSASAERTT
jgi:nicotinamide-nucleotide amidase